MSERRQALEDAAPRAGPIRPRLPSALSSASAMAGSLAGRFSLSFASASRTLSARLVASSIVAIILALLVAGLVLHELYARSVERTFDARLNVYLAVLAGEAVTEQGELARAGDLGEPRFELPLSGWYWQIRRRSDGKLEQASISLFDGTLSLDEGIKPDAVGVRRGYTHGAGNEQVRMIERDIALSDGRVYGFAVAGEGAEIEEEKATFADNLRTMFFAFALFLFLVMGLQVWFGLRPLADLRRELWRVRLGEAEGLGGTFPGELQPLADDLNALIRSNAEIVERSRTHLGNLAHALKTPLSVIVNEARLIDQPAGQKIAEQAELMRERTNHALGRARMAATATVVGAVSPAAEAITPLVRSMERIYRDKELAIEAAVPEGLRFRGERQDFQEIVGNLLDNACKWARARVALAATEEITARDQRFMLLAVEDDGPGLTQSEAEEAVKRGRRLDETKPGSGLGLSIVTELVTLYGGSFALERSAAGGLRALVRLPSI